MKNKSIIVGIVIIAIVCIVTTGCGFNKAVDSEGFRKHFGALGYNVIDTEEPEYEAEKYLVAQKDDSPYKVLYYEFKNEVEAKKVYEKYTKRIVEFITTDSSNKETTGALFSKFVAKSTDEYIVISRVKNTVIFVAGLNDYAKEIDSALEDIKY